MWKMRWEVKFNYCTRIKSSRINVLNPLQENLFQNIFLSWFFKKRKNMQEMTFFKTLEKRGNDENSPPIIITGWKFCFSMRWKFLKNFKFYVMFAILKNLIEELKFLLHHFKIICNFCDLILSGYQKKKRKFRY